MVRPKTLGEEKEDSEEEEEEIQIVLTSKDPNVTSRLIRWTLTIFNLMKMIFFQMEQLSKILCQDEVLREHDRPSEHPQQDN